MFIENILEKINEKFKNDIHRLNHVLGVYRKAIELARFFKVNIQQAQIAALFHDYTKNESLDYHLSLLNPMIINRYQKTPFIYHAFSAAIVLQKEFNIQDEKILNAIRKHVWGAKSMNKLDKIIFLSDKLENNRSYEQINYFRKLSLENIDLAICKILEFMINYYKKKGFPVLQEQLIILNIFKKKINFF